MLGSIGSGHISESAARQPKLRTGERLLIAVVETDTLGWVMDQMDPDTSATIEMNPHSDIVYAVPILSEDSEFRTKTLEELGLTRDSTAVEVFDAVMAAQVSDMKVAIHI